MAKLQEIGFPEGLERIGAECFRGTRVPETAVPAGVETSEEIDSEDSE